MRRIVIRLIIGFIFGAYIAHLGHSIPSFEYFALVGLFILYGDLT